MSKAYCVRDQLARGIQVHCRGQKIPDQKYGRGGEHRKTADDRCFEDKEPCSHLVVYEGGNAVFFVPVPEVLRVGRTWKDLDFWVQE